MLDLLILTAFIVWAIDLTDFIPTLLEHMWKWIWEGKKPYPEDFNWDNVSIFFHIPQCSLCASFWIGLFYIFITNQLTFPMFGYVCLLSFLTPVIKDMLILIRDIATKLIEWLSKPFE